MFTFEVNKNNIELTESETVTSGSVNVYFCHFIFSSDWDGLAKTITFRAGDTSISILLDSTNMCTIPWEVLQSDALQLYAGARGTVTATDTEEEAVIPTVYCLLGTIRKGTELGDNAQPPVPSVVDQLMAEIKALDEGKQDKLVGREGQVVSFDEFGNVISRDEKGTEYKAGENISISADNTISAAMYDDTEIRGEINSVKSKTEANTAGIAANAEAIAANSAGIEVNAVGIAENKTDITKNTADIAKNSAGLKTVADKVDTLNTSFSNLSKSVADNTTAINAAGEDIAALSLSVTAAEGEIAKNTTGLSAANEEISVLKNSKQDKLHGVEGQVVGFDKDGNAIAQDGGAGTPGKDGVTFTPMVSPEGVISWTNDGGRENPAAVNIKGPQGPAGTYTAGDNIEISEDGVISAKTYDDTALKADIAKNTASINSMKADISTNTSAIEAANTNISDISSSLQSVKSDISANTSAIASANANISGLSESKQDKLSGSVGQVVGFDAEGNAVAQEGGVDGVTFTPAVSTEGIISWSNDGGRENPAPVNIKGQPGDPGNNGITPHIGDNGNWYIGTTDTGVSAQGPQGDPGPAGTYSAGAGIAITNDVIGLKNTASTKYNSGVANITGIGGFDFTLTSQTSSIISLNEYLKTSPSGEGSTAFKTRYGYAQIKISARRSATLSTAKALRIVMSDSVNITGAAGFARITLGEGSVTSENIYLALVYADSDYLYVYPTQTISIAQSGTLSIDLYVH